MNILKPGELGPMGPEIQQAVSALLLAFMRQYPGLAEAAWKGTVITLALSNGVKIQVPRLQGRAVDPSQMPGSAGLLGPTGAPLKGG